eukprot:9165369-Pyramimonas_sp.AAC.1
MDSPTAAMDSPTAAMDSPTPVTGWVPLVAASDPTTVAAYVGSLRMSACVTQALTRALNSRCP